MNKVNKLLNSFKLTFKKNPVLCLVILFFLFLGTFLRSYRPDLMAFNYDQGRDALVIWKLWHEGKFFLIGPVTGLAGIFLGPFYYYLIAPFYILGQGNPLYPYFFLVFLTMLAVLLCFYIAKKMHSNMAGLFALIIASSSAYIIQSSRWLSNPTPLLLTSVLLLFSLWKVMESKKPIWWMTSALLIGLSMQLEAASGIFYIPMFIIFSIWQRKKLPSLNNSIAAFLAFFVTLIPQIIFNFRHDNILLNNFYSLFVKQKGFSAPVASTLSQKLDYFWGVFYSKIFVGNQTAAIVFIILSLAFLFAAWKKTNKKGAISLLLLFILTSVAGIFFFQGNHGNLYDYYMTGIYLPFIILFSLGLAEIFKKKFGILVVLVFFVLFFIDNIGQMKTYFVSYSVDPERVSLGNELQAVNWVFEDAKGRGEFNVDEYVPPVIPYTYNYLFLWQGTKRCGISLCGLVEERKDLLYTLYEVDPPHPDRIQAWFDRQNGIGKIVEEVKFLGIGVRRRERINKSL